MSHAYQLLDDTSILVLLSRRLQSCLFPSILILSDYSPFLSQYLSVSTETIHIFCIHGISSKREHINSAHIQFPGTISAHYIVASTIVLVSSPSSPSVLVSLFFHQPNPALSSSIRHSCLDLHTAFQVKRRVALIAISLPRTTKPLFKFRSCHRRSVRWLFSNIQAFRQPQRYSPWPTSIPNPLNPRCTTTRTSHYTIDTTLPSQSSLVTLTSTSTMALPARSSLQHRSEPALPFSSSL